MVLIVDDDFYWPPVGRETLEQSGFTRSTRAPDGETALDMLDAAAST